MQPQTFQVHDRSRRARVSTAPFQSAGMIVMHLNTPGSLKIILPPPRLPHSKAKQDPKTSTGPSQLYHTSTRTTGHLSVPGPASDVSIFYQQLQQIPHVYRYNYRSPRQFVGVIQNIVDSYTPEKSYLYFRGLSMTNVEVLDVPHPGLADNATLVTPPPTYPR
ncbi:hypothetical protein L211DRAFT_849237 [Terfezia boudieri ATCC MYA-4762]|uniref:Uncharacterized protein n=1 Tax=Terfezia boudieri ATCC MYA-4762 TaxID=1051890 RepID=A0A3N4LML1_9PEZI|nr:hypothetical protein L211DRAFT_849237 [Terfezia boudieri ATCC MYA-4762]